MQKSTETKIAAAKPRSYEPNNKNVLPSRISTVWKPQPCGFTREEMRQIVAEQID
jgi:hypothetical protein